MSTQQTEIESYTNLLMEKYNRILLSKIETANELHISGQTLDRLRRNGGIKAKKVLGQIHFSINEIARYIAEC